jgi:exopolysaccharide biosynthesis polyprenyl glycosylphosphotransferase
MATESQHVPWSSDWGAAKPAPRASLRLSAAERKWLLFAADLVIVNTVLAAAVILWNDFPMDTFVLSHHLKWFITLTVVWFIAGTILDVYNLARAASTSAIVGSAGSAALVTALLYLAIPWLTPPILRRTYGFALATTMTGAVLAWRIFYAQMLVQPFFRQYGLIVGDSDSALELTRAIQRAGKDGDGNPFRGTGYEIVGRVTDGTDRDQLGDIPSLGSMDKLVRLARQSGVDEIILANNNELELSLEAREVLLDCREVGLRISNLADVYERLTGRLPVHYAAYDLQLLLSPDDSPSARLYGAAKRAMDIVLSAIGLLILCVILPLIALANAISSPGPLFYRQQRIGKGGRPFTVIKLRSMIPDAERCTGAVWCGKDDPRITKIGRLLRKSRLDETPQLFNILRGEMSIVGPRPERPSFVGQLSRQLPLYRVRHAVKPGLTGWAQVHLEYGDSIEDSREKLEYDLFYVRHASLYLDLLTLLHTVRVVVGLKGQ